MSEQVITRYVSFYGDGAVLDCSNKLYNCRINADTSPFDYESDEDDEDDDDSEPFCIVEVQMKKSDYLMLRDYCRNDNMGAHFNDGYEAASFVAEKAIEQYVVSCTCSWTPEECDSHNGCYLCGGDHRE